MYPSDSEAKKLIVAIGKKMSDANFVTANDGNLTIRVSDDAVWATPTGVNKGELTEELLIKVRIADGAVLEGSMRVTSEIFMHLNAYRTDDSLRSTAHAHPLHLTLLACAGIDLDLPSTPAAVCIAGRIPVIPYCCSGSRELAESIIPYVMDYHVVNLGNHGPLAWGKTPIEAWYRLENAEASARLALELLRLGRLRPLSCRQIGELLDSHHIDMPEAGRIPSDSGEENREPGISFTSLFRGMG